MNETIQRGDCFKLLAACFYEPEKSLFIEEQVASKLALLLDDQSPDAARAARDMETALQGQSQEGLSVAHAALFVGPFELLAAPYGSVYIEKKRRVMEDSTLNAARSYQEAGLSVDIKEPADHIVIELEFMYYLCNKEATAGADGVLEEAMRFRDIQARFYHYAMKPWVASFCDAIRTGTDSKFYAHLAECLECFLISCDKIYSKAQPASAC